LTSKKMILAINGAIAKPMIIFVASFSESPTDATSVRSIKTPVMIVAFACKRLFASISTFRVS
jgi:hypothetical protein